MLPLPLGAVKLPRHYQFNHQTGARSEAIASSPGQHQLSSTKPGREGVQVYTTVFLIRLASACRVMPRNLAAWV